MKIPFIQRENNQSEQIYKIDVHGPEEFERWVIKESFRRPVVVDFWAPWCAPCRILGPTLESLAAEFNGRWLLVKLNTDEGENQNIAIQYNIRGIPAVKAFKDGQVIEQFVGALPPEQVRFWLEKFVPSEIDEWVEEGEKYLRKGDLKSAEELFDKALAKKPRHSRALFAKAQLLAQKGDKNEALRHLEMIVDVQDETLEREIAKLKLSLEGEDNVDLNTLQKRVEENPEDWDARIEYGRTLAKFGNYPTALSQLLKVVESGKGEAVDKARSAMVEIFEILGHDHELTEEYREKLAAALYR